MNEDDPRERPEKFFIHLPTKRLSNRKLGETAIVQTV